jgi:hypothetical protein
MMTQDRCVWGERRDRSRERPAMDGRAGFERSMERAANKPLCSESHSRSSYGSSEEQGQAYLDKSGPR